MGQRHQCFIKIVNPTKYLRYDKPADKKNAEKEFGTGKFSILSYHNQWLYGHSALGNASRLLSFASQFTKEEKSDDKTWGGYDIPFGPKGMEQKFNTEEKITTALAFIMNFRPVKSKWLDAGIGGTFYIGKEDEGINQDFTLGDNNDGITIIDLIENKYCFMNIYEKDTEIGYTASDLPHLKPVSAEEYVKAYYGETVETYNPYYTKDKTAEQIETLLAEAKEANKEAIEPFSNFKVLTEKEIQKMFPKMEILKPKTEKK